MTRLLLVEDDDAMRETVETFLDLEGFAVEAVSSTREALTRLATGNYPLVLSDIYLDERTGLDVLQKARECNPRCEVILMTGRGSMETVMRATQDGAFDYVAKPFELDALLAVVRRAEASLERSGEAVARIDDLPATKLIGVSPGMIALFKTMARVAATDATVLIEGETGTGKELIARELHRMSRRADQTFLPVDCGAIAPSLLESELFGSLRGAYTGADRDRLGLLEAAHLGTLFLDEIGEIDGAFQLKLLRFLNDGEVKPVGAFKAKKVDVRVIAATNRELERMVEEGKFREDLWYRLNVVRVVAPPLRERHGDLPLLAQHFVDRANERFQRQAMLLRSGLQALGECTWPGNVRQLQHLLERLVLLAPQGRIDAEAVRDALAKNQEDDAPGESLAEAEAEQIRRVLAATAGNKSKAAKILGIERKTLYRKLERMNLS